MYLGRYEEALKSVQKALQLDPKVAAAHDTLGQVYGKMGRHQEAAPDPEHAG